MKVLITGSNGFIAKNLITELEYCNYTVMEYHRGTEPDLLDQYCKEADFVYHLAGVNRPDNPSEFMDGNFHFTSFLLESLKKHQNYCPILLSSSIQAERDNEYGRSKKAGEDLFFQYSKKTGAKVLIYRLPNVFGKWSKPNYNSAIATFCHNIARNQEIDIHDSDAVMNLVYIDDVVKEFLNALNGWENKQGDFCEIPLEYTTTVGKVVKLIYSFKESRNERSIPNMSDFFTKKLYSTYLSYLPKNEFSYDLKMNVDERGSFTEFIKTEDRGQVSVNISKPGITKGNHWHHTKNEKFLVVSGKGVIRFRKIDTEEVIEYFVSGGNMEVVDIPTGYTHNIENLGDTDMVTIMWANEFFDPQNPDTYYSEV